MTIDLTDTRIDYKLRDLLVGVHTMPSDREQRVIFLDELRILYNATLEAGWARHTNDWDFECQIYYANTAVRNYNIPWSFVYTKDNTFTACVEWAEVHCIETYDEGPRENEAMLILIDSITSIHIEQAG